jgi:formate hydrogenlyase subunit 4
MARATGGPVEWLVGTGFYLAKLFTGAMILGFWEVSVAKMRVFRVSEFLSGAFVFAFLAILLAFLAGEVLQ